MEDLRVSQWTSEEFDCLLAIFYYPAILYFLYFSGQSFLGFIWKLLETQARDNYRLVLINFIFQNNF
jgi:hypothetical protein